MHFFVLFLQEFYRFFWLNYSLTFSSSSIPAFWDKPYVIQKFMSANMTKSEMIEQLSAEYGMSEESATASLNSYYRDDNLGLREYFDDLENEDDVDRGISNEDNYGDESWS